MPSWSRVTRRRLIKPKKHSGVKFVPIVAKEENIIYGRDKIIDYVDIFDKIKFDCKIAKAENGEDIIKSFLSNANNGDGCSSTCTIESKFTWSGGSFTSKDTWITVWGDEFRLGSEYCDDGNSANGDGWSSLWTVEDKFLCSGGSSSAKDTWTLKCGYGFRVSTEQCDDGNILNGDGCMRRWLQN